VIFSEPIRARTRLVRCHLGPNSWGIAFKRLLEVEGLRLGQGARNDQTSDNLSEVAEEQGVDERTARRRLALAQALEPYPNRARL